MCYKMGLMDFLFLQLLIMFCLDRTIISNYCIKLVSQSKRIINRVQTYSEQFFQFKNDNLALHASSEEYPEVVDEDCDNVVGFVFQGLNVVPNDETVVLVSKQKILILIKYKKMA